LFYNKAMTWSIHDIVVTNIVWCIAYKPEVGRGTVHCPIIVQYNSIAPGWAMQVGGGNKRMVDSCTTASKHEVNEYLVKVKL